MAKRLTLEEVQKITEREEYTLLNSKINSSKDVLVLLCPNKHTCSIKYSDFTSRKRRCKECKRIGESASKHREFGLLLEIEGYVLLDSTYINMRQRCKTKCPNNHLWSISFTDFKLGVRCPTCNPNYMFPLTQDEVETRYREHNYILITEFTGSKSKVTAICPEGHEWEHLHSNFQKGLRCSDCSGKRKYLLDEVKQFFIKKNFTPTFTVYNNSKQILSYVCNEHPLVTA